MKIKYFKNVNDFPNNHTEVKCWDCDVETGNGMVYRLMELPDGRLSLHVDNRLIIEPNAANSITLDGKRF